MQFTDEFYVKEGYVCYYEGYEKIYTELDEKIKSFLDGMKYKTYNIPAMIEGDVLEKCGYFESFPDQISVVGSIDDDKIPDIMNGMKIDKTCINLHNRYLTPSACLHIYPMYTGKEVTENEIVTTKARVYRCEKSGFEDMTRLWDFSVREIVFIGERDFVKQQLEFMKNKSLEFAKKITDKAEVFGAHDHFYKGRENAMKARIQKRNEQKFELRIPIGERDVSVASFNFHNEHFSKPFGFDNNNKIVSGCVGFGMERWVAACEEYNIADIKRL